MCQTADQVFDATLKITGVDRSRELPGRIEFQKVAFLIHLVTGSLAYRFHWGKHGPYSPTLAEDLGEFTRNGEAPPEGSQAFFESIQALHNQSERRPHEILELVGSYAFLTDRLGMKPGEAFSDLHADPSKRLLLEKYCPGASAVNVSTLSDLTRKVKTLVQDALNGAIDQDALEPSGVSDQA